jgi:hypothetical protein
MRAFYESQYYPNEEPTIKFEEIEVDFENIKTHISLRKGISRALSLRVWQKHVLDESTAEIKDILILIEKTN